MVLMLLLAALTGCQDSEEADTTGGSVNVRLALTVAKSPVTRMADQIVQGNGVYRGLDVVSIIPFTKKGKIELGDNPARFLDVSGKTDYEENKEADYGGFYLYDGYTMLTGTASFLVYGKAPAAAGGHAVNGKLTASIPAYPQPSGIRFYLQPMLENATVAPEGATKLAAYLTNIAEAEAYEHGPLWSNTTNSTLKAFFLNFTSQANEGHRLLAGSGANVLAHVNALYKAVSDMSLSGLTEDEQNIRADIMARIKSRKVLTGLVFDETTGKVTALGTLTDGTKIEDYPGPMGLPDGAAVLRWQLNPALYAFVPQLQTTTLAKINTITRYSYPPELYYYTNSRIYTSNHEVLETQYGSVADWETLLQNNYEYENGVVSGSTQSAAITEPLKYGVARLEVTLLGVGQNTLTDAQGKVISVDGHFPLTGIIVGGQNPVGFNFKPVTPKTDADVSFVYDSQVKKTDGTYCQMHSENAQAVPSTLVLESYDDDEVPVILEFRNNSGESFHGVSGIVYPDTKFYLIGTLKPASATGGNADNRGRVFTQDYVTKVNMKVTSLAKAYNVLPDMLGGRLEVGIELTPDWVQATPSNTMLE